MRIMRSDSLTDREPRTGLTSTKRGSMSEEVGKVAFGIFCAIADGIIEGFGEVTTVHPPLEAQALIHTENVAVWRSMRGVIPSNVFPFAGGEGQEDNCKIEEFAS